MSFVGISFYVLSLLFGPCRLSEFTLSGPLQWNPTRRALNRSDHLCYLYCQKFLLVSLLAFEGRLKPIKIGELIFVQYLRPLFDAPRFFFPIFVDLGWQPIVQNKNNKCLPNAL